MSIDEKVKLMTKQETAKIKKNQTFAMQMEWITPPEWESVQKMRIELGRDEGEGRGAEEEGGARAISVREPFTSIPRLRSCPVLD